LKTAFDYQVSFRLNLTLQGASLLLPLLVPAVQSFTRFPPRSLAFVFGGLQEAKSS
jgi:hypothetical protein